jgi:hypothetical protein
MRAWVVTAALLATTLGVAPAAAQTLTKLQHPAPDQTLVGFVLTDGTVLVQGGAANDWWKLTPDNTGSYVRGTWSQQASLPSGYVPLYFASAVLADGRVVIAGGEYNNDEFAFSNVCAIYDPVANTWAEFAPPAGWDFIGDSPSSMLPDGRWLLGSKFDQRIAALDPATLTWTALNSTGKRDFNAEEGWTLLPNGTVMTYDVKDAPHSEIYYPTQQTWHAAGSTVADLKGPPYVKIVHYGKGLIYRPPGEVGPAILRPDGSVFAAGDQVKNLSYGRTSIYTPPAAGKGIGHWAAGPDFPVGDNAGDSFAALLPSGNVLVEGDSGKLYEFNGTKLAATNISTGGPLNGNGLLLVLPTGEVLVGGMGVYTSPGSPNPAWAPVITSAPTTVSRGSTYKINGQQFNGLSQANGFGDEMETATNYPLVRITSTATGHVFYARTHGHSTMGVATGAATVSTHFDVPAAMETGAGMLVVVANGIASTPVAVTVQ